MALNAVAHPESIEKAIEAIYWEDTQILEVSTTHDDVVLITISEVTSKAMARDVLNRALGGLGQYVILSA